MASVKVKFRPSSVNGKEGCIYYQMIHNREVRQVKTDCRIFESEWNGKASAIAVPVLASNERKNYLQSVASRIEWDAKRLTAIIALLEKGNKGYTVDDILVKFNRQADGQSLFPFMQGTIGQLKRLNRIRTSETYTATLASFMKFRDGQDILLCEIDSDTMMLYEAWLKANGNCPFGGGGMMERVHHTVLSYLDFDGQGQLLDVGCGSGALSIRAALIWPDAQVTGIDYWGAAYGYGQIMCERNAAGEGVAARCQFQHGDANHLNFPDESFDAVVSNYVYHNINRADKRALLMETLRVLKKGGVFALNDEMKPRMYGDVEEFAQELRDMGYQEVRLVDTAEEVFGSRRRAAVMMLGSSRLLVGRK